MLREPAQRESDTWLDSDRKQPALRGREREGHHGCAGVAYRAGPRLAAVGRRRYRTSNARRRRRTSLPSLAGVRGDGRRRMSKRKATADLSVEELLHLDIGRTVMKAVSDTEQLAALGHFAEELAAAVAAELKKQSKGDSDIADDSCTICDMPANRECVECEDTMCEECETTCDFGCTDARCLHGDDGCWCGNRKGCGRSVCSICVVSTECGNDVAGCQACLDDYDCPDCDQCACG